MKVAVISEPHLGRRQFRKTEDDINVIEARGYDQWHAAIDEVVREGPDALFITGDLFDSPNPSSIAVSHAISGYETLSAHEIAVITIGGNHEFSIKNHKQKSHPFKVLGTAFPQFSFVSEGYDVLSLPEYDIVSLPHQPLDFKDNLDLDKVKTNGIYTKIASEINRTDKKSVLLTHGVIESWAKSFTSSDEIQDGTRISNMIVPDVFAEKFDYVFIGHNHQHFFEEIRTKDGRVSYRISPGSILDERNNKDNGPMFLDLKEEFNINYIGIPNINTYKSEVKDLNKMVEVLNHVEKDHIYLINFKGEWESIPNELYQEAFKKALYLNINVESHVEQQNNRKEIKGFWEWIKQQDPELAKEFKKVMQNAHGEKDDENL